MTMYDDDAKTDQLNAYKELHEEFEKILDIDISDDDVVDEEKIDEQVDKTKKIKIEIEPDSTNTLKE